MAVRRDERGAAVVEFAIVLPVLVMLIFGIIEFGRGYNAKIELTSAVREGARAAALGNDPVAATRNAASGLTTSSIVVTTLDKNGVPTSTPCPATPTATDNATVKATYPFSYDIPLVASRTVTLTAIGVMRCGG